MSETARFCDQCGAAAAAGENETPSFRHQTRAPVATSESAAAARKTITVLFCDLVGSTGFGEAVDAEAVREAIGRYHAMAQAAVDAHNGTVAKFIGDGVMAVFGIPEVGEDDADRAVATGLDLQAGFDPIRRHIHDRYGFEVGLRVGINTGEVVIDEQDADIVGDALNTAARLESVCSPGRVLVGVETWRLTRSTVKYEVLGEVTVRGKAEPVETFQVIDETPQEDDAAAPFVSRNAELGELRAVYDRTVADRRAHIATVIGDPGVGKTRLAGELARACSEALHLDLRCERSGAATFAPVIELLRGTCGIDSDQGAADTLAAIGRIVGESEVDRERVVDLLGSFVGASTARSTEESFFAVRRLLEVLGASRPVLLVVDDIQWAEPLFLDLLEHLVEWVSDAPILIVALARPEIRELRASLTERGRRISVVLSLEGLDASATEELAARLLGADSLPAELTALLPESTDGNPLFVRELVRMLVDDGVVARGENGWQMTVDAEAVQVPPTIQSLLAARVERMPPADRRFVELASIVGSEFPRGAVGAIVGPGAPSEIEATIERLRRRDVIEPTGSYWGDEPIYRFHHVLIRDAAYRRILKQSRADLHVRVGEWTEHTAAELVGEYEASIAFHYEQAHQCRTELGLLDDETTAVGARAAALFQTAATRALERDDLSAAGSLARRALARLGAGAPSRRDLLLVACESLLGAGNVVEGQMVLEELDEVAADPRLEAWGACFRGQLINLSRPDELSFAEASVATAAEHLAEIDDQAGVAKARQTRAGTLARLGRVGECEAELDLALTAARSAADGRRVTAVLGSAPVAALWGPSPVPRAGGRCLDVIRLLRITTGSPAVEATAVRCQAVLEALRGRFDTARTMLASARASAEELGLRHGLMETELYTGIVELLADRPVDAEPHLRAAYGGLDALGIGADAGQAGAHLARALLLQGRIDEAEELVESSDALAGQNPQTLVAVRSVQAEIQAARGNLSDAITLAQAAVALVARSDLIVDHAQANLALARVWAAAGDATGEASALAEARRLFELKGATVDVRRPPAEPPSSTHARHETGGVVASGVAAEGATGSIVRDEVFHEHDAARAIDRFEELTAPAAPLARLSSRRLANRCTEVVERGCAAFEARDVDRYLDCFSDPFDYRRRHFLAGPGDVTTREGLLADFRFREAAGFDHMKFATLAVRNDDLCLGKLVYRTADGQEQATLRVVGLDAVGRVANMASFEPDDLPAAVAELERMYQEQLDVLQAGWYTEFVRFDQLMAGGHVAPALEMFHTDCLVVDRRDLGWGPESTIRERIETLRASVAELVMYTVQVHHFEVGLFCASRRYVVTLPDGGVVEQAMVIVVELDPGTATTIRLDQFGEDQVDQALAYVAERRAEMARHPRPINHATWSGAICDYAARLGYIDRLAAAVSPSAVRVRGPDGEHAVTADDLESGAASMASLGFGEADRRLIAVRAERLALVGKKRPDGSTVLELLELDEDLRVARITNFPLERFRDAVTQLDDRFLQLLDTGDPSIAKAAAVAVAWARAGREYDLDAKAALLAADAEQIDLRPMGFGIMDRRAMLAATATLANENDVAVAPLVLRLAPWGVLSTFEQLEIVGEDGWTVAIESLALLALSDRQVQGIELFAPEQLDEAMARFDALSEAPVSVSSRRLHNMATRLGNRRAALLLAGDLDGLDQLTAPGCVSDDRRTLVRSVVAASDAHRGVVDLFTEATSAIRAETLATRGERLALVRVRFEVDGFEVDFLVVELLDELGRQLRTVFFDIDALMPAFDELNRLFLEGEGAPYAAMLSGAIAMMSALNDGDADAYARAVPERMRIIDHRPMGWPEMQRDEFIELTTAPEAMARGSTGYREIHRLSESGSVATGFTFVDNADALADPGWQYVILSRSGVDDENIVEFFAVDDLETATTRFDELEADAAGDSSGHRPEPWNEADRLFRQFVELFDDRPSEDWLEMLDPEIVDEDRQPIIGATLVGREAHRAVWTRDIGERRLMSTVETVAVRGDRLALHRWRLGVQDGGLSWDLFRVSRWNERDLVDHSVGFAVDDLAAAIAELDRQFLEEVATSYVGDAFRVFSRAGATLAAGDVEGYLAYSGPAAVMVDHRQLGWPELDIDSLRPRLDSIVNMPGDVVLLLERYVRVDPTWSACWVQSIVFHLPDGVEQVQRSVMAMVTDDGSGRGSRIEQFDEDRVADALARLDEMVAQRGEQLINRASMCWGASYLLRRAGRADLIVDSFGSDGFFTDERGEATEPFIAERLQVIAVRGELLALAELHGRGADGQPTHCFAVEEIDVRGHLLTAATFPPDKRGLTDAANLLESRWQEIEGSSSVITASVAWSRAHRSRDVDELIGAVQPDVLLIDHRPLGFSTLDRDALVSLVGEPDGVDHGVLLGERIVSVNDHGLVVRFRQWRFDSDDQMTMLAPSYCVVNVRDGRVDRFELFPDDDPAPAIARLDELT